MRRIGRPPLWRCVGSVPYITYFKPAGIPLAKLHEVQLTVEEAEAVRLKDLEGLQQEDCADRMRVSRPTFVRMLNSAREKIADALLNAKAIRIEGGNFQLKIQRFACESGHQWDVPFEAMLGDPPQFCPTCNTPNLMPIATGSNPCFRRSGGGAR